MSQLRRAVYDGDGPAMVAAVSAAGFDGCLQLVGEVLIGALDRAAPGADDRAGRCVAALRARDWDGDRQLADTLEQARAATPSGELVELAVDLEQLADLLDAGPDSGPGRLDLVTGEAWPQAAFEDEWTDEPNDDQLKNGRISMTGVAGGPGPGSPKPATAPGPADHPHIPGWLGLQIRERRADGLFHPGMLKDFGRRVPFTGGWMKLGLRGAVPRGVVGFEVEFLGAYLPFSIAASSLSRSG